MTWKYTGIVVEAAAARLRLPEDGSLSSFCRRSASIDWAFATLISLGSATVSPCAGRASRAAVWVSVSAQSAAGAWAAATPVGADRGVSIRVPATTAVPRRRLRIRGDIRASARMLTPS
jgi:hypothetical protein